MTEGLDSPSGAARADDSTDLVSRVNALFAQAPRDWAGIETLLIQIDDAGETAPAQIWFEFGLRCEQQARYRKGFNAAKQAAVDPGLAPQAWRLALRMALERRSASSTALSIARLLQLEPDDYHFLRHAMKLFGGKQQTEDSVQIIRRVAPFMKATAELVRYIDYADVAPELNDRLIEWALALTSEASPSDSLAALGFLLNRGLEPPAHLPTNVLENPDPELDEFDRLRSLLRTCNHAGARDLAVSIYRRIVDRGDSHHLVVRFLSYSRQVPGLPERLIDWARNLGPDASEAHRKDALKIFGFYGLQPDEALAPLVEDDEKLQRAWRLWAEHVPPESEMQRPPLDHFAGDEITVSPAEGPAPLLIVFSGLSDNFSLPPPTFDRFVASLGASAVYMSDSNRLCFTAGAKSLDLDFDGTVNHLRGIADELGATRIVTLGTSAGGFSAMLYGLHLKAHSVLAFGSVTNATPEYLATDPRGRAVARRAARLVEPRNLDVRPLLADPDCRTRVHLYFGAQMPVDTRNARHLEDFPTVRLHPEDGLDRHQILRELVLRGRFQSLLRTALYGPG